MRPAVGKPDAHGGRSLCQDVQIVSLVAFVEEDLAIGELDGGEMLCHPLDLPGSEQGEDPDGGKEGGGGAFHAPSSTRILSPPAFAGFPHPLEGARHEHFGVRRRRRVRGHPDAAGERDRVGPCYLFHVDGPHRRAESFGGGRHLLR